MNPNGVIAICAFSTVAIIATVAGITSHNDSGMISINYSGQSFEKMKANLNLRPITDDPVSMNGNWQIWLDKNDIRMVIVDRGIVIADRKYKRIQ